MENAESGRPFDSSRDQLEKNLESSPPNSTPNSNSAEGRGDGSSAGRSLTLSDLLLSRWLSLTGDIRESGVAIRIGQGQSGLVVTLENVFVCPRHQIHLGQACPMC